MGTYCVIIICEYSLESGSTLGIMQLYKQVLEHISLTSVESSRFFLSLWNLYIDIVPTCGITKNKDFGPPLGRFIFHVLFESKPTFEANHSLIYVVTRYTVIYNLAMQDNRISLDACNLRHHIHWYPHRKDHPLNHPLKRELHPPIRRNTWRSV